MKLVYIAGTIKVYHHQWSHLPGKVAPTFILTMEYEHGITLITHETGYMVQKGKENPLTDHELEVQGKLVAQSVALSTLSHIVSERVSGYADPITKDADKPNGGWLPNSNHGWMSLEKGCAYYGTTPQELGATE